MNPFIDLDPLCFDPHRTNKGSAYPAACRTCTIQRQLQAFGPWLDPIFNRGGISMLASMITTIELFLLSASIALCAAYAGPKVVTLAL
jgi:hypothetical protein